MPRFSGIGSGQRGGWRKRSYNLSTGEVRDDGQPAERKKRVSLHTRFRPFWSHQLHKSDAEALGLPQKGKATYFGSERQLNEHLAREKRLGRDTGWRDYRKCRNLSFLPAPALW